MTERILFVCTANICRSPMAEALLRSELEARNPDVEVWSAGFLAEGSAADKKAAWAMSRVGLDVTGHLSTKAATALDRGPDLILVMAREHLRRLAKMNPDVTGRTFTLKEFVLLGDVEGQRTAGEPLKHYLERVAVGRSVSALTSPGTELDVEDPIGRGKRAFTRCALELQGLVKQTADLLYPLAE